MSDEERIEQLELEVKVLRANNKGLKDKIEELKKENLEIRDWKYVIDSYEDLERLKELDLVKIKGKEYISKDIIKEKIEQFKQVRGTILDNEAEYKRPMMTYDLIRNDYCEKMLQSLLEEE